MASITLVQTPIQTNLKDTFFFLILPHVKEAIQSMGSRNPTEQRVSS